MESLGKRNTSGARLYQDLPKVSAWLHRDCGEGFEAGSPIGLGTCNLSGKNDTETVVGQQEALRARETRMRVSPVKMSRNAEEKPRREQDDQFRGLVGDDPSEHANGVLR